ncbi:hypothetical protein [Streptomyces sp. TE33382]
MKALTRIRSSSAMWVTPVVLLLMLAYYLTDIQDDLRLDPLGYAPTVVDAVLRNLTPVAYAVAAALGAWEARKLGKSDLWQWGAVRSRYTIAAHSLAPVVVLAWLILVLPTLCGLVQKRTPPDAAGTGLVAFAMLLCAAHAVIGFAWGVRVRHIAAVPVIAVVDFLFVGWSVALTLPWPRHLTGLLSGKLMFGELPTASSFAAPLLIALGLCAAVVLLWSGPRRRWLRPVLAAAVAMGSVGGAYTLVKDWSYVAPRSMGHGPVSCAGEKPRICLPSARAGALPALSEDVDSTLKVLRAARIEARPATITDSFTAIRYPQPSTATAWHIPLAPGTARYQVARAAVRFTCEAPATGLARQAYYWVSRKVGEGDTYLWRLAAEPDFTARSRDTLRARVDEVLGMSARDQTGWFRRTVAAACEQAA